MGKDSESWLHQQQRDGQFPNAKSLKLSFDQGIPTTGIPCAIPCTGAAPTNGGLPSLRFPGQPDFMLGQFREPHGWFYCLPHFRQGLIPGMMLHDKFMPNIDLPSKVTAAANENPRDDYTPTAAQHAPKQFLVFDQTGNKTTMIFSSGIGTPIQPLSFCSGKPTGCYYDKDKQLRNGSNGHYHSGLNLSDELGEDQGIDEGGEMHEDTDEINALLYSDNEGNYSDDGEETSTGHSPSTMTAYEKQDWFDEDEDMDEVASSAGPAKRQKTSDSGYEVPSVTYTVSSLKPKAFLEFEDDAESSCVGGKPMRRSDICSLSGNKRARKEKVRETVSILQTILPGGKGKDAIMVLDEAINYLKALKFKAKSLGVSGL